jgi:hypothetical protein
MARQRLLLLAEARLEAWNGAGVALEHTVAEKHPTRTQNQDGAVVAPALVNSPEIVRNAVRGVSPNPLRGKSPRPLPGASSRPRVAPSPRSLRPRDRQVFDRLIVRSTSLTTTLDSLTTRSFRRQQ